jgi:hypothetical protein
MVWTLVANLMIAIGVGVSVHAGNYGYAAGLFTFAVLLELDRLRG